MRLILEWDFFWGETVNSLNIVFEGKIWQFCFNFVFVFFYHYLLEIDFILFIVLLFYLFITFIPKNSGGNFLGLKFDDL